MASLDILCSNSLNLKNKIMKIEHKKIFCGPSKILKNFSLPINICLKCFMTPTKSPSPGLRSYILNVRSLSSLKYCQQRLSTRLKSFIYIFVPNKSFGSLLEVSPKNHIFLNTFYSEFQKIEVWFTDQKVQPLEIEDK